MDLLTGSIIAANIINAAKNLWELTFAIDDDPAKERTYRIKSSYEDNADNERTRGLLENRTF